ncbi:MAG TPA: MBL fold metallo-hydrolase [Candidatus Binataceae bacterium]|nr:MBL fold metallo-hydrolase [Candidatus Binataceae bacterium]
MKRAGIAVRLFAAAIVLACIAIGSYALAMEPDAPVPVGHPDPAVWPDAALTIANLGHATLLMNYLGVRVISDPALFNRVGMAFDSMFTIGPRRVTPPPLAPAELRNLDVILITHAHMDHLDIPSLKAMPRSATVIACGKCAALIAPLGFTDVRELKWGESTEVKGLTVRAMAARHWGKRWPPFGADYGFNSYVLEKDGVRMLLACDSAYTDIFSALKSDPPELAAFSIGAYDPWIWNHANPEQVWTMFVQTGARYLVPIHWGTFKLSKEPMDEPLARLIRAAGDQSNRIVLRQIGGTWRMPERATAGEAPAPRAASSPALR